MRIVHIITRSTLGGAQSVVINLANQQSTDNEVFVISGSDGNAWEALHPNVCIIKIKQLKRAISLLDFIVIFKLLYYRFHLKPDIIHLHSSKIGILGRLCFPKRKIVYTVHGFDTIRIANKSFLWLEKLLKKRAAQIVAVSRYDFENLKKEHIQKNICYIYNGIEDNTLQTEGISAPIAQKIQNLKKQYDKLILCIARTEPPKRLDLFLNIAEQLPNFAFIWIGNTSDIQCKHSSNTYFLGSVINASLYIRYSDLFILPSNFEGLPISIIEALSYSKPVIASNVGGIKELLSTGAGFTVQNSSQAFKETILQLTTNPQLYSQLSTQARCTFLADFTVKKMADTYKQLYQKIYKRNNGRCANF